ncbi:glycosyltransferase family 4 protein [Synechococcus sp. BA-132 BA5]|uniref:glycosyltransferase family 4 protein n=1 Tax=Synechococcus sp. BA-132 BA5 TaxID=3110252 RepID=UPI002B21F115|nr:glycosyltransferase family 4 protein [Synechococcus sp. BA-132 BA5]MEA5413978.1 glycosyltransferase family 4 protein [Synechococcus sp. BA-132 BA5]
MATILVLWSHHSGYLHGCLQELARYVEVTALFFEPAESAPFAKDFFGDAIYNIIWINPVDLSVTESISANLSLFQPDLCLCSGWHHRFYMHLLSQSLKHRCIRVLCFDWQWAPTFRNYLKAAFGSLFRSRMFDACFVAGERQYQFARRAGFPSSAIYQGLYSASVVSSQSIPWGERRNRVVFVGRLVESKGCRQLAAAWSQLQTQRIIPAAWSLDVFGVGPLESLFIGMQGCQVHGFRQPDEIAEVLASSKILCAPSLEEPWGVQIHEATLAGLAVVATDVCGSAVHLVRSGFNGEIVSRGDAVSLLSALSRLIQLDEPVSSALEEYGSCSKLLSRQFSPVIWANTVMRILSGSAPGAAIK